MPPSVFRAKNNRNRLFIFGETDLSGEIPIIHNQVESMYEYHCFWLQAWTDGRLPRM